MASTRSSGPDAWIHREGESTENAATHRFPLPDYTQSDERFPGSVEFLAIKQSISKKDTANAQQHLLNVNNADNLAQEQLIGVANEAANFARGGSIQRQSTIAGRAKLYMPPGFEIQDGVQYENVDFGVINSGIKRLAEGAIAGGGGGLLSEAIAMGKSGAEAAVNAGSGAPINNYIRQVAAAAANVLPGAGDAIRSAAQMRSNPNSQSMFEGVAMRSFGFTFNMMPSSEKEAEQIRRIVKFFRFHMYPERVNTYFYKFPTIFNITMRYKNKILEPKILPSFLTSATVNYNGETGTFFKDGNPTQTTLTLSFQEERTLHRGDINRGY